MLTICTCFSFVFKKLFNFVSKHCQNEIRFSDKQTNKNWFNFIQMKRKKCHLEKQKFVAFWLNIFRNNNPYYFIDYFDLNNDDDHWTNPKTKQCIFCQVEWKIFPSIIIIIIIFIKMESLLHLFVWRFSWLFFCLFVVLFFFQ